MAKAASSAPVALALFFAVVAAAAHAQTECNVRDLVRYCDHVFATEAKPTEECCDTLKAQEFCFCDYLFDPVWSDYFNRRGVLVTIIACGMPVQSC